MPFKRHPVFPHTAVARQRLVCAKRCALCACDVQQRPFVRLARFLRGCPPGAVFRHMPSTVLVVPVEPAVATTVEHAAELAQLDASLLDVGTLSENAPAVAEATSDLLATLSEYEAGLGRCVCYALVNATRPLLACFVRGRACIDSGLCA